MRQQISLSGSRHPAPQRGKTQQGLLWFSVIAAPLGWVAHLLINYAIAGQYCVGGADVGGMALPYGRVATMIFVDFAAALLAVAAGYFAYQHWLETRSEKGGGARHLVHSGEGRTRFLAMCGMLASTLFGVAVVIDAIGTIVGPPC